MSVLQYRPSDDPDAAPAPEHRAGTERSGVIGVLSPLVSSPRAILEQVSALLAASLDFEATLKQIASLAVPVLADWCIIHLIEANGSIRWLASAYGDPAKEEIARELQRRYPRDPEASDGTSEAVLEVMRTGRPLLQGEITDAQLVARARDADHLRLLRAMASCSSMIVPLVAHGRTLGAVSFLSTRPGRQYGPADLELAQGLVSRAALALDNARLYRDAQAALRLRDEILAVITHDLLQPVTTVKASAELLLEEGADADAATTAWLVGRIDAAATRMTAMVGDLLDLAQAENGRPLELQRHTTNLVALARQQAKFLQRTTTVHDIRVDALVPALVGKWDVQRLERVIGNLLANSVKYSPEGGEIVMRLSEEHDAQGAWAQLAVQDGGLGIPEADLPHIFERFYRGANAVGRIKGTGIGLAGAKQIVEQHGGTIAVESEEGVGTTLTVRLPLA